MSSLNHSLSPRSMAEVALIVSKVGPFLLDNSAHPSIESIRMFWKCTRSLEQRWTKRLAEWSVAEPLDVELLEQIGPRVFLCETISRLWGTVLAGVCDRREKQDMTLLARNAINGLVWARNALLSKMLKMADTHQNRIFNLDKIRRRTERWTDLLIGPLALKSGCFEFAIDRDRAREFGEEGLMADSNSGPNAYEHLVSAGLRLKFGQYLSQEPVDEPEFPELMHSILSNLPQNVFHRDGTLRSKLEQRLVLDSQRPERRGTVDLKNRNLPSEDSTAIKPGGSFFINSPHHGPR